MKFQKVVENQEHEGSCVYFFPVSQASQQSAVGSHRTTIVHILPAVYSRLPTADCRLPTDLYLRTTFPNTSRLQ